MGKINFDSHKIRDPIHGFCCLSELECKIIDSWEFQRLRDIKQLWPVNLIYPGAVHTRFEHSIGVCHITGQIARSIGLSKEEQQIIRLAALLHDIGHGPFSHVSEDAIHSVKKTNEDNKFTIEKIITENIKLKKEKPVETNPKDYKKHEMVSFSVIKEILPRFKFNNVDEIINLLKKTDNTKFGQLYSIISGPLDTDKMDYLLRDSFYCGVEYGKYDLKRLINSFSYKGKFDTREIVVEDDDVNAIEQFALARYYLYQQVTTHKTTFKAENLFSRAIRIGVLEGLPEVCKYYKNSDSWMDIRDSDVFNWIKLYQGSRFSNMLSQLLIYRKIPKIIYEEEIENIKNIKSMSIKELENLVFKELKLKDEDHVIACFQKENDLIKEKRIYKIATKKEVELEKISKILHLIFESTKDDEILDIDKERSARLSIMISFDDWQGRYGSLEEKTKMSNKKYLKDKEFLDRILGKEV